MATIGTSIFAVSIVAIRQASKPMNANLSVILSYIEEMCIRDRYKPFTDSDNQISAVTYFLHL